MTDDERRAVFDAAVANCLTAHPAGCLFGGWTVTTVYWLPVAGCPLPHFDTCVWCGATPTTGFTGWAPGHHGEDGYRFAVPACATCAAEWVRIDPQWTRGTAAPGS